MKPPWKSLAPPTLISFASKDLFSRTLAGRAGLIEGCAGKLLRLRKKLGCEHIKVFGDVKKKHCSHALTGDLDILDEVKQAEFFLVDGVIVTGARTAEPPSVAELRRVKKHAHVPVLIGSGIDVAGEGGQRSVRHTRRQCFR